MFFITKYLCKNMMVMRGSQSRKPVILSVDLLRNNQKVQVSDTTKDGSRTKAKYIKKHQKLAGQISIQAFGELLLPRLRFLNVHAVFHRYDAHVFLLYQLKQNMQLQ
jgi:hypothetical protein